MNYVQLQQIIQDYAENTESLFVANIPKFVEQAETRIYNFVNLPALRKNVTGTMTATNQYLSLPNDWLATYSVAIINATTGAYTYLINKDVNFIREAYPFPSSTGAPKYYALFGPQYTDVTELSLIVGPTPDQSYSVELHYFYYPPTIVQGQITTLNSLVAGSLYTPGIYSEVSLTGGSGANATATIVVSATGAVSSVTLNDGGSFYVVGDVLSFNASSIGSGTGSGFTITVSAVSNSAGTSWLGDNYDPVLFYGAMREAMIFMKQDQDQMTYYENKFQEAVQELKRLSDGLERGDSYRDGMTKLNANLKGNTFA